MAALPCVTPPATFSSEKPELMKSFSQLDGGAKRINFCLRVWNRLGHTFFQGRKVQFFTFVVLIKQSDCSWWRKMVCKSGISIFDDDDILLFWVCDFSWWRKKFFLGATGNEMLQLIFGSDFGRPPCRLQERKGKVCFCFLVNYCLSDCKKSYFKTNKMPKTTKMT